MKIALGIFICVFISCILLIALAPNSVHKMIDRIHGNSDKHPEDTSPQLNGPENTTPRFSGKINRYSVSHIDFSPDGQFIAVASELGIELYNAQTYNKEAFFEDKNDGKRDGAIREEQYYSIMFSPDGQMLASANHSIIKLWSVAEKRETATFKNEASVFDLAFSPDGQTLAVGSDDDTIRLWSISERREFAKFGESVGRNDHFRVQVGVFSVRFSPDGRMLASEEDGVVSLWSFPEGDDLLHFGVGMAPMSMGWLWCISFSPDMKMLASGHFDGTIRLWVVPEKHEITPELMRALDRASGEDPLEITFFKEDKSGVNCLAFSADGRTLISGHESGAVQIWDIPTTYQILLQPGKSKLPE